MVSSLILSAALCYWGTESLTNESRSLTNLKVLLPVEAFYVPQQVTAQVYRITEEKEENVEKRHSKQFNISGLKKIVIFLLMDIVELHSSYKFRVEDEGKTKG